MVLLMFLLVPIAEIYLIIQVGQVIGPWWTILLLIAISVLGAWLVKREGRRAWRGLREATQLGRLPARELADAALIVVGGTLLLTPGFLTDIVGLFLILPVTRPIARRLLTMYVTRRAVHGRRGRVRVVRVGGPTMSGDYDRGPRMVPGELDD